MNTITTDEMVANIREVYALATTAQIEAGKAWYDTANVLASALANEHNRTVDSVSGIVAALSPLNSWGSNVNLAVRMLESYGQMTTGYLGAGLLKARQIHGLGRQSGPAVTDAIHEILVGGVKGRGWKVSAFFECIRTTGETDAVCIDRHAIDIAFGIRHTDEQRPRVGRPLYLQISEAYRLAGVPDLTAAQVQAVTWLTWRDLHHTDNESALFNTVNLD